MREDNETKELPDEPSQHEQETDADFLERWRRWARLTIGHFGRLMDRASDQIEELQKDNRNLKKAAEREPMLAQETARLRPEVERLTDLVKSYETVIKSREKYAVLEVGSVAYLPNVHGIECRVLEVRIGPGSLVNYLVGRWNKGVWQVDLIPETEVVGVLPLVPPKP